MYLAGCRVRYLSGICSSDGVLSSIDWVMTTMLLHSALFSTFLVADSETDGQTGVNHRSCPIHCGSESDALTTTTQQYWNVKYRVTSSSSYVLLIAYQLCTIKGRKIHVIKFQSKWVNCIDYDFIMRVCEHWIVHPK